MKPEGYWFKVAKRIVREDEVLKERIQKNNERFLKLVMKEQVKHERP